MLKHLINIGTLPTEKMTYFACKNNRLEILKFLISIKCPINNLCLYTAIKNGHFNIVKYLCSIDHHFIKLHEHLYKNGCVSLDTDNTYNILRCIEYAREHGYNKLRQY